MKKLFCLVFILSLVSCTREPKNYDDCILKYAKEGMNQIATREVVSACRSKFEDKEGQLTTDLPADAIDKISGKLRVSNGHLNGNIYNGNEQWIIREVVVGVRDKPEGRNLLDESDNIKVERYRIVVNVLPLKSQDFYERANWSESVPYAWYIISAKGESTKQ